MADAKRRLGRGLEALISAEAVEGEGVSTVAVGDIEPNPYQPRREFSQSKLEELAASIKEHGVVQPIIVRRAGSRYQLVAGERRWRAAGLAGLTDIPAVVRELTDEETMEVALIENIQRQDLNPIEEARAYLALMEARGLTQEGVALRVGKSRPVVANTVRLLTLEPQVQRWIEIGKLTAGHARALAGMDDPAHQREVAQRIIEGEMSVREAELLVRTRMPQKRKGGGKPRSLERSHDPDLLTMAEGLQRYLGTRVRVKQAQEKGLLEIDFYGGDDLERLYELITHSALRL